MAKLTLNDVNLELAPEAATAALNANWAAIEEFAETVLSRDGESPNQMEANLDMNGKAILNHITELGDGVIRSVEDGTPGHTQTLIKDLVFDGAVVSSDGPRRAKITISGGSADDVTYDNGTSGLAADNVQDAIDELAATPGGVISVNGETGVVTLSAADVDALPDTTTINTLVPSQTGNADKVLGTNGTVVSWVDQTGGGGGGSVDFSGVRLTNSAAQTLNSNADTSLTWDTEVFDTDGYFTSSNPSRITVPATGYYSFEAITNNGSSSFQSLKLRKNGSTIITGTWAGVSTVQPRWPILSGPVLMNAGDYMEVIQFISGSGSTQNTDGPAYFGAYRLGNGADGGMWTNVVTQPFSANTTGFSSNGSGTWAISGGVLQQSVSTTNGAVFYYTTPVPYVAVRLKCEVNMQTSGAGSTSLAGLWYGPASPGSVPTNSVDVAFRNVSGTKTIEEAKFGGSTLFTKSFSFTLDAFHQFELVIVGMRHILYIDGVVVDSFVVTDSTAVGYQTFGLFSYDSHTQFKNFTIDVAMAP